MFTKFLIAIFIYFFVDLLTQFSADIHILSVFNCNSFTLFYSFGKKSKESFKNNDVLIAIHLFLIIEEFVTLIGKRRPLNWYDI